MWPGRFPGRRRGWRLPHPPEGVWHLRLLPAMLVGFSPGLETQVATGNCRHYWPHSGSAVPSPGDCQAGLSCCPPAPPAPGSPLPGAGACSGPGPYSPWMASDCRWGFPGVEESQCFRHTSTFSEAKRGGLAPCIIGTSLSFHSCLHLEAPLKNCVCLPLGV